jgi:hypothetical protein
MSNQVTSPKNASYKRAILYSKLTLTGISILSVAAFILSLFGYFVNTPVAVFCVLASGGLWLTLATATRENTP